jgi:putative phosphoesterase
VILGILSDTHGRADLTALALSILRNAGAQVFIHCGDVGGKPVLDQLAKVGAHFVWGNTDEPGTALTQYVRALGLPLPGVPPLRLNLGHKSIAVFHGHELEFARLAQLADRIDPGPFRRLAAADYVFFGHRHVPYDRQCGPIRVINPGAIHRAQVRTVATLDLARDRLHFWIVDPDRPANLPPREWAG